MKSTANLTLIAQIPAATALPQQEFEICKSIWPSLSRLNGECGINLALLISTSIRP